MDHVSEIAYGTESPKEEPTPATATEAVQPQTTLPSERKPEEERTEIPAGETEQPTSPASVQTAEPELPQTPTKPEPESEVTKPVEEGKTAVTTELPREEENEIEHDEVEPTGPKVEEEVTETVKPQEEVTAKAEEGTSAQPITEKAIVPEVCTSEVECAPSVIPSSRYY